ncbi:MAG: hypothetical protein ACI82N_000391 [Maricaulis sp.]
MAAEPQTGKPAPAPVMWDRRELSEILNVYGRFVAMGEWKDYAIDGLATNAVFSIFRRASEVPMFAIIKTPADAQRQGMYKIVAVDGQVLKRGHELAQVLRAFDKKRFSIVS